MSALDGFMSTWNSAHAKFGQGIPEDGAQIDKSAQLRQLQGSVESAAPGSKWMGGGADSYGDANARHARTIGELAGLDKKLATEVSNSAAVVAAGRRDLDRVKQWVLDAAAAVPNTKDRDRLLMPIVGKGSGEIAEIIKRSHGDLAAIGGRIQTVGNEYQALGGDLKQGIGDPNDPADKLTGDQPSPEDVQKAQDAVTHVLDGTATPEELAQVREGLKLTPPQQADYDAGRHVQLSDDQKLILGQMQGQMHDMSIHDIHTAEQRLGNDKNLIGDSLQMMSSSQFDYTKAVPLGPFGQLPATFQGGDGDQLPTSVKEALTSPAAKTELLPIPGGPSVPITTYPTIDELHDLAGIVHDGNPALQQGTYLDRGLMDRGAEMLAAEEASVSDHNPSVLHSNQSQVDPTVQDIFSAAGRDQIVDHDIITGAGGTNLLHDMSVHDWADNGHAAATLTDWVHDAAGSPNEAVATRAGETAHSLAAFMSDKNQNLLSIPTSPLTDAHTTMGALNPDLLRGFSNALTPYQNAMVGDYTGTHGFAALDNLEHGKLPLTQQIFAVMDSDELAGKTFNEKAYENALAYENQYGTAAANGDIGADSPHRLDMMRAGALAGMVEAGANEASGYTDNQSSSNAQAAYDIKKNALDFMFDKGIGHIPIAGDIINAMGKDAIVDAFVGERPTDEQGKPVFHYQVQDAQNQADYNVAAAMISHDQHSGLPANYFDEAGHLKGPAQIPEADRAAYYASMRAYLDAHGQGNAVDQEFRNSYNNQTTG